MILIATGLSFKSSTSASNSGIAIFEKQLIIENDTNFAAGVPISSAISEKSSPQLLTTHRINNFRKHKQTEV